MGPGQFLQVFKGLGWFFMVPGRFYGFHGSRSVFQGFFVISDWFS